MSPPEDLREISEFLIYTIPAIMILGGVTISVVGYAFGQADLIKAGGASVFVGAMVYVLKILKHFVRRYSTDEGPYSSLPEVNSTEDVRPTPASAPQTPEKTDDTSMCSEIPESSRLRGEEAVEGLSDFKDELEGERSRSLTDKQAAALARITTELALTIRERVQEADQNRLQMSKDFRSACAYDELLRETARDRARKYSKVQ
jgi:hypothetical protein